MKHKVKANAIAIAKKPTETATNTNIICLLLLLLFPLMNNNGNGGCLAFLPSSKTKIPNARHQNNHHSYFAAASQLEYMEFLSQSASDALNRNVKLTKADGGGGISGGGGATTSTVMDVNTGEKYFVKAASKGEYDMLQAEYLGVKAMANTNTVKVPEPICTGVFESGITQRSFVMLEYLEFTSGGSQYELGVQLAKVSK